MGDSDQGDEKPGVPSWQLEAKDAPPKKEETPASESPSRDTIIQQGKKFLEEDEVRNASTDKKIAFLESKGLRNEEIQDLLGVIRNSEPSAEIQKSQPLQQSSPPPPPPPFQQAPSQPPIITYPEFLTTPTASRPLITKTRLLTTLYLFSGLSAILYGTNRYLITPMLANLTDSRLSLAETASTNLSKLISQLEGIVSKIPTTPHTHEANLKDEDEESDEDPTELFHRDIGVQTSPRNSESGSRPGSPSPPTSSVLEDQASRLKSLKESLGALAEDSTSEGYDTVELETTIGVLREQLDSLAYVAPNYGFTGVAGYTTGNVANKEKDDEILRVKAEIKSMKGVLLSARSFPGGVRAGSSR